MSLILRSSSKFRKGSKKWRGEKGGRYLVPSTERVPASLTTLVVVGKAKKRTKKQDLHDNLLELGKPGSGVIPENLASRRPTSAGGNLHSTVCELAIGPWVDDMGQIWKVEIREKEKRTSRSAR